MSKRTDALKRLIAAFPSPPELDAAIDALYAQPDRVAAIMACAMLDNVLEQLIRVFIVHKDKEVLELLFGRDGNLRDLAAKINVAHAFGVISPSMADELHRLKRIRNVFAHAATHVDFQTTEIALEAHGFRMLDAMRKVRGDQIAPDFGGKRGYVLVAKLLMIMFDDMIVRKGGRSFLYDLVNKPSSANNVPSVEHPERTEAE